MSGMTLEAWRLFDGSRFGIAELPCEHFAVADFKLSRVGGHYETADEAARAAWLFEAFPSLVDGNDETDDNVLPPEMLN